MHAVQERIARLRSRPQRGASSIELALYTPIMFLIIFIIVQFSLIWRARPQGRPAERTARPVLPVEASAAATASLRETGPQRFQQRGVTESKRNLPQAIAAGFALALRGPDQGRQVHCRRIGGVQDDHGDRLGQAGADQARPAGDTDVLDHPGRYAWIARARVERVASDLLVDAAHRLSVITRDGGDPATAAAAARAGLRVRPAEQLLWHDLILAQHAVDGRGGVMAVEGEMSETLTGIGGIELAPETAALLEDLVPGNGGRHRDLA